MREHWLETLPEIPPLKVFSLESKKKKDPNELFYKMEVESQM